MKTLVPIMSKNSTLFAERKRKILLWVDWVLRGKILQLKGGFERI